MNRNRRLPGSVIYDDGGYDLPLAKASVGQGWHGILERLFAAKPDWIKVVQVKEKFGGLRFYLDDGTVRVDFIGLGSLTVPAEQEHLDEDRTLQLTAFKKLVDEAEAESFSICEDCGAPAEQRPGVWIHALCEPCLSKRRKARRE
jgi:hypothetical protein